MHDSDFRLFETFRLEPQGLTGRTRMHIDRLEGSARELGFPFGREEVEQDLEATAAALASSARCRLEIGRDGRSAIEAAPLPEVPATPVGVKLLRREMPADDPRLRFKTTDRSFYDQPRDAAGTFEVLFLDDDGFLTEGSFTNLFVRVADNLITPPLARGLLPGILRQELIGGGRAFEGDLRASDLAVGFFVGNSLRGLIPAGLLQV